MKRLGNGQGASKNQQYAKPAAYILVAGPTYSHQIPKTDTALVFR